VFQTNKFRNHICPSVFTVSLNEVRLRITHILAVQYALKWRRSWLIVYCTWASTV